MQNKIKVLIAGLVISLGVTVGGSAECVQELSEEYENHEAIIGKKFQCLVKAVVDDLKLGKTKERLKMLAPVRKRMKEYIDLVNDEDDEKMSEEDLDLMFDGKSVDTNEIEEPIEVPCENCVGSMDSGSQPTFIRTTKNRRITDARFPECVGFVSGKEAYKHLLTWLEHLIKFCKGKESNEDFIQFIENEPGDARGGDFEEDEEEDEGEYRDEL